MAQQQSHLTVSTLVAIAYCGAGVMLLGIFPEQALLAGVVIILAGLLPNVDSGHEASIREFGALLAAVSPLVVMEFFPAIKGGGVSRIALVVICSYILTRVITVQLLNNFTVARGMLHSIPAAIITFEIVYLIFWDLFWKDRLYIASAALAGYLSHLLLDSYGNMNLVARAFGKAEKKPKVLKFAASSAGATFMMYTCILVLGWVIANDIYPGLSLKVGLKY